MNYRTAQLTTFWVLMAIISLGLCRYYTELIQRNEHLEGFVITPEMRFEQDVASQVYKLKVLNEATIRMMKYESWRSE